MIMNKEISISAPAESLMVEFPLLSQPGVTGTILPFDMVTFEGEYYCNLIYNSGTVVPVTNALQVLNFEFAIAGILLTPAERAAILANDIPVTLCIADGTAEGGIVGRFQTLYIVLSTSLAEIADDTAFLRKARRNKNATLKIGSVTYDIAYDDDNVTEILRRALTTPAGGNLPDMSAGTYPANAAKSSV